MSKKMITLLIIAGVLLIVGLIVYSTFAGSYNNMVAKEETVSQQWAQVENVYQRRADLIPNLVSTVKGYADFEQETLTSVIEARAKATSVNINADNLTEDKLRQFEAAQSQLSSSLGRLLVSVERYPELKANEGFLNLQTQLEGAENRIAVERKKFNDVVKDYNTYLRTFPRNMLAGMYGFEKKAYFHSEAGAEKAPEVKF